MLAPSSPATYKQNLPRWKHRGIVVRCKLSAIRSTGYFPTSKMVKTHVTFDLKRLNDLLNSKESCVTLCPGFSRILTISPMHLTNIKDSIRELLQAKVTTYDPELDGIILSHKNIKIIDSLQLGDYGNFTLKCIADVYIFKPTLGCILKGIINKRGKDHLGCLVHSIFNVSIPRVESNDSMKPWPGNKLQIGQEVSFTVTNLNFNGRLPYIKGELIDTGFEEEGTEEVDSGIGYLESVEEYASESFSEKKKKKKKKDNKHKNVDGNNPEESGPFKDNLEDMAKDLEVKFQTTETMSPKKKKRKHFELTIDTPSNRSELSMNNSKFEGSEELKSPVGSMDGESFSRKKKKKKRESITQIPINGDEEISIKRDASPKAVESEDLISRLMQNRVSEIGIQSPSPTPGSSKYESPEKISSKKKSKKSIESTESVVSEMVKNAMTKVDDVSLTESNPSSVKKKKKDKKKSLGNESFPSISSVPNDSLNVSTEESQLSSSLYETKSKKRKRDKHNSDNCDPEFETPQKNKKTKRSNEPEHELNEIQSALIAQALASIQ